MNRRLITSIVLGIATMVCVGIFYHFSFFDSWQEKIIDRFFIKEIPDSSIVIVAIDDRSIKEIGQWPWKREVFGNILEKIQGAQGIAFDINFSEPSRYGSSDDLIFSNKLDLNNVPVTFPVEINDRGLVSVEPLPIFLKQNSGMGSVNIFPDSDGVVRRTPLVLGYYPLFAFLQSDHVVSDIEKIIRINFKGPEKTFLTVPFIDVLNDVIPSTFFDDKNVLIGATAPNLQDFVSTPFGRMPGVELHANILNTLLKDSFFVEVEGFFVNLLLLISVLGAFISGLYFKKISSLIVSFVIGFILILLFALIAFSYGYIVPVLYIEIAFVMSAILNLVFQYVFESKEKKFIRNVFQYYLTPQVIDELIQDPSKVSLGGEERDMTILFSDIRGFTTISEALSPQELTSLLNEYLTAMTDIVMEEGGVVDKYIGDAVMAFWGAPLALSDQADRACKASLRMKEKLDELNKGWVKRGLPELHIGIGLNKGKVVVGNMGSSKRFNYTVMGDEVNFASRLEGITKQYGVPCLVSESVVKGVTTKDFIFRDLDLVLVKGKKEPRRIFDIVSFDTFLSEWNKARDLYTKGKWQEALEVFEEINKKNPEDKSTLMYIKRCEEYKKNPPLNWQGVHEFKDK